MASDTDIKNVIEQITAVKSLLQTETVDGITTVKNACSELGEFETVGGTVKAKRYGDMGMEKETFFSEAEALDWITENR